MKRYSKIIKKILSYSFLAIFLFITITSVYENIQLSNKRNNLINNSILDTVHSSSSQKIYVGSQRSDDYLKNIHNPGAFCDILLTEYGSVGVPVLHDLVSFTVGGHAGIVGMHYQDKYINMTSTDTIETTFNNTDKVAYIIDNSSWNDIEMFPDYYIFRVYLSEEDAIKVFNDVISNLGDDYNISFLFNTKSSCYCSDIISKAFRKVNINLNYDFGVTTVLDLAASKYTNLVGYKKSSKNVSYYYFNL